MNFQWLTDDDGDHLLEVDGRHFGLVCPHHKGHVHAVWDCGFRAFHFATLEEAKAALEREVANPGSEPCWRSADDLLGNLMEEAYQQERG